MNSSIDILGDKKGASLYLNGVDYCLFCIVISFSFLIGVYFGFFGKRQNTVEEYLHGGRKLGILPIAASLIASEISGITFLGVPADIYMHGTSYWCSAISSFASAVLIVYIYLPVFYKLQIVSSFEYLKLRFGNTACMAASFVFAFTSCLLMPIIVYIPALAFSQVTGMKLNLVIPIVCIICIFYTTIGGIRAVVWTDTLQLVIMIGSILTVAILGVIIEGGFAEIWQKSIDGQRIDFNLDIDPTHRTSSFAVVLGLTVLWSSYGANPVYVQRYLSVSTYTEAKTLVWIFTFGSTFFKSISSFIGLILYARYSDCDPLTSGAIQKPDQLIPYYIMDATSSIPGLPGLFVAGIFCAAMSTMSSALNTMAGTIYRDFLSSRLPSATAEQQTRTMKIMVVVMGLICTLLVFGVQYLGTILQLTLNLLGIATGPILAMFALGMTLPFINGKGILCGTIAGFILVAWIFIGYMYNVSKGYLKSDVLPNSVEGCDFPSNLTIIVYRNTTSLPEEHLPFYPYRITFYYYTLIGFMVCALVAIPVSLLTGGRQQNINPNLLCPFVHRFLSRNRICDNQNEHDMIAIDGHTPNVQETKYEFND